MFNSSIISSPSLKKTLIISTILLTHSQWGIAESIHPNTQPLAVPNYASETKDSFSLPAVDNASPLTENSSADVKLLLKRVEFRGQTAFTDTELQAIAAPFINTAMSVNELEQLRFLISQHYSEQGYVNSGATLPQQTFQDGLLKIEIIEGQLSTIQIKGQGWLHPNYIRWRLQNEDALNVDSLQERYLMLINDPLIDKLNANLQPTGVLGESQLNLEVTRAIPYGLTVQANNYRAPSIGSEQLLAHGWVRNLTRWGDLIDFTFGLSEGSTTYAGGISLPIHSSGTLFDFHFNIGDTSVIEEPLNSIDISSKVENFSWTLSQPIYRSVNHTFILGTNFSTSFNQTTLLGEDFSFIDGLDSGKSRTSVMRFFQEYLGRFDSHVIAFRSTFNVGIDAFNSTIQADNSLPDSEYFSWLGQIQYAFKILDNGAQIKARGAIQLSDETLLPQEKISIGGVSSVRGYRENELVRDQGYYGSLEFHYPIIGQVGSKGHHLVLIPFMDYGTAWNKNETSDHLHSIGIGLNWQPIKYINTDFYYGYTIKQTRQKNDYNLQDSGIHFNLTLSSF